MSWEPASWQYNPESMFDLSGKRAIVTGAGSGLGRAIALGFDARGATVFVADIDEEAAEEVANACADGIAMQVDVTDDASLWSLREGVRTEYGTYQVLCNVPAIYSYDHTAEEYIVYEHGEQHLYETKSALEEDWVRVKKPFIPESEFSIPAYSRDSYVIVVLPDKEPPAVYTNGTTNPLGTLLDHPTPYNRSERDAESENEHSVPARGDHLDESAVQKDPPGAHSPERTTQTDARAHDHEVNDFETFVEVYVAEDDEAVLPKDELYNAYRIWAIRHEQEIQPKSWFSRSLGNFVTFDTSRVRRNGNRVNCYTGIALTEAGHQLIE